MSISVTKITNKIVLKNKRYNLSEAPVFTNKTTENSTDKNKLITNSQNENKSNNDYSEKENLSPNIILGTDNEDKKSSKNKKSNNTKTKKLFLNQNNKRGRNFPLKSFKNNFQQTNENSKSKGVCNNNNINKSIDINSFRTNFNTNNNKNNFNKNNFNKNIFIDKLINNKYSPSRNILKPLKQNMSSQERINSLSNKINKNKKKINTNIIKKEDIKCNEKRKDDEIKNKSNKLNKILLSRNCNLKISYSVKNNSINNQKSISSPINKTLANNDNVYFKKKIDDSFKLINIKRFINKKYNNLGNHNFLVNLLLDENINKNNNIKLYNIINKKQIKNYEISNKSSLCSKYSEILSFNNNLNKSNSNSIPNIIFSKNNNNFIYSSKESPIKAKSISSNKNIKDIHIKRIYKSSKDNKNILTNKFNKSKDIKNKNKEKHINKTKSIDKIKHKNKIQKCNKVTNKENKKENVNKSHIKKKYSKTSENSMISKNDSYLDYLLDTYSNSKNKNENLVNLINDIKTNKYDIQKPKEENMKFTLLKNNNNCNEESIPEVNKSKIIIGNIEGYKDIIEKDKINNIYENTISIFDENTLDKNKNNETKRKNKKILLNTNDKNYSEIYNYNNFNNNNYFISDSEIKSFINCIEDKYDSDNLSTTILKRNKKNENSIKYKYKDLLPYHVNKISFVQTNVDNDNKSILKNNINNDNILLINDKNNRDNNNIRFLSMPPVCTDNRKKNNKDKETIDINEEYFIQKDILIKNKNYFTFKNNNVKQNKIKNTILVNERKDNKKNNNNYLIQNICNINFEDNDKKCIIF